MASPTDKPALKAASIEAPGGVDFIELRKVIRFLNSLDLAAFKSYLGIAGEGGGPILAEDIADLRLWLAGNRVDQYGTEPDNGGNAVFKYRAGVPNEGSGIAYAQYHAATYLSTGTDAEVCVGFSWGKNTSPCPPGLGHYHNIYWPRPPFVAFRFGFPTTLAAGAGIIGYYGTDNVQRPTDLDWAPVYSGYGFQVRGDGSLLIYIDNQDTNTHTLHTTGVTVNVAGAGACLVQEVVFIPDGAGNVDVWLNLRWGPDGMEGTHVGTFSGLPIVESATDCYPMLAICNQSSGATVNDLLIFPLRIMGR